MYGVTKPLEFEFYGFHDAGGTWIASLYDIEGAWVADRGETALTVIAHPYSTPQVACMVSDPSGLVGDGSLIGLSANDSIFSWDVAAEAVYTYTAEDGKHVTWPAHFAGWLYWWEWAPTVPGPSSDKVFTLRKARPNLSAVQDWGSATSPGWPATSTSYPGMAVLGNGRARVEISGTWVVVNLTTAAVTFDGSGSNLAAGPPKYGVPDSANNTVGAGKHPTGNKLTTRAAVVNASETIIGLNRWPTTWGIETVGSDGWHSFGLSADRATALLYTEGDFPMTPHHAFVAPSTATSGSPTLSVDIGNHPDTGTPPECLFLKT